MKSQKILIFFGVVVLSLTMLCVVFPADGVTIGKLTIRFPKLHKVLVREKEVAIEDLLVVEEAAQEMDAMSDSNHRKSIMRRITESILENNLS